MFFRLFSSSCTFSTLKKATIINILNLANKKFGQTFLLEDKTQFNSSVMANLLSVYFSPLLVEPPFPQRCKQCIATLTENHIG